ncbi:tRNA uracil 4-sulfurtransferase ThiI [Fervidobacterium nodosum]|uniref:Probable tRNA sulfurtransferase n=1 Tax=Fervidobacterium nodosum (strain ATCC 35602 / DSM 5306 / Rt17-B1) TaxID=381764 RepID=A7HL33_FERNB|nr:tRNA uracil 4-sulfurtransferase ThiI [Fervidobacterium nodosum]ABS60616.1 thiamine biosynthesis/tRNA modification protein ThiI [Fervidobacterium nodosum Rt17-B1]PHJ12460.1 thiamine biosynthesis protein ThiI [Fervidobacterium sp. SC_NGM5_G05]
MERVFVIRYSEIGLKGKNREFFEKKLIDNILKIVRPAAVNKRYGRIIVRIGRNDPNALEERLKYVMGIQNYSLGYALAHDIDEVKKVSLELAKLEVEKGYKTFKVSAQRGYKDFPLNSIELNREIGGYIYENIPGLKVDVHNPEFEIGIDVREKEIFVFSGKKYLSGGLPVGVSGRALLLLSGGIDSPVAGWYAMRRGLELQTLTFLSPPMTTEKSVQKILDLGRVLARYLPNGLRMWIVPLTEVQMYIKENAPDEYSLILQRRSMMRIANMIARRVKAKAIITGENLGQVASQTLTNMAAIEDASSLLVLRPLIGFDKIETTNKAKEIGTFEISIQPYIDSCVAFAPKKPATKSDINEIRKVEEKLDELSDLEYQAFKKRESYRIENA